VVSPLIRRSDFAELIEGARGPPLRCPACSKEPEVIAASSRDPCARPRKIRHNALGPPGCPTRYSLVRQGASRFIPIRLDSKNYGWLLSHAKPNYADC
jgi:hypothetical protein